MTKQKLLRFVQIGALVVLLTAPVVALPMMGYAQNELDRGLGTVKSGTNLTDWNIRPNSGSDAVVDLIVKVIKLLLMVAGAIAVLFIIIGGFQYLTSGANPDGAKKGKQTVVNALIGLVIIVLSYVLVTVVYNLVK